MRRMITRLLIAQLIPLALRFIKKAFRKKKTAQLQSNGQRDNIETSSDKLSVETVDVTATANQNVSDQGVR